MSRLRAKCPDCKTQTAVALGPEYECHACGRTFGAGMVRVPRAWGDGGEAMAESAWLPLPYPEAAVIEEDTLGEQSLALAHDLPARPLVLGGDCCSHIGAVEGLSAELDRIGVVWFDAHGDLNTPETSPSGNTWGMPLRMLIDSGAVAAGDVALVGARNLDPPEEAFIAASGVHQGARWDRGRAGRPRLRLRRPRLRCVRPARDRVVHARAGRARGGGGGVDPACPGGLAQRRRRRNQRPRARGAERRAPRETLRGARPLTT